MAVVGCVPGDRGCCGSLGRISNVVVVVDARVVEIVDDDSLFIEVDRVRGAVAPGESLPVGERVQVATFFDDYQLDGDELTFFLSTGGLSQLRLGVAYVHDRTTDGPVAGFPDEASGYGASLDEMLECLVTQHATGATDQPLLAALVAETTVEPKLEEWCLRSRTS